MNARRKLVLVDGSSYLYRAFHALPPLTNSRGEPTGAVFGVLNMLQKLIKDEAPQFIAVVVDAPGRTFRDALFDQYKATRQPMPDELRTQVQPLLDCVQSMGLPLLRIEGVEADDVIATLATQAATSDIDVVISTGDKDMAQLVNERISLVNTMTGSRLDRAGVKTKFDVYPEQIVDYLALVGDTVDNIPGVPKVGPKTAAKWLNEYQTLDALVGNAAAVSGKVGESLRASLDQLELSKKLATLDCAVKLEFAPETLVARDADRKRLQELYSRLELRSLLRGLGGGEVETPGATPAPAAQMDMLSAAPRPPREYETVTTPEALQRWIATLRSAPVMSLDLMTTAQDYMQANIIGIALACAPGKACYIPVAHDYAGAPTQLTCDAVLEQLRPLLESEQPPKVGHNLKLAGHVLRRYGIELHGMRYDSMLESYVWNSTATRHELATVARKYLGIETIAYEAVTGRGAKQIGFNQAPVDTASAYAAESTDIVLQLHQVLWPKIESEPPLRRLYDEIEQPLISVLLRIEQTGVLIDGALLKQQSGELAARIREIEAQAHAVA
ncbi:MAG TPA: 5'-3' exonuclease H3TH domain-containing protein, partial [Povalibacter sp.]|nr:5'-3' exonuclease H3TH domain-containing protein [Povalibacter sp.]